VRKKTYVFRSSKANLLYDFIEEKQSLGFSYEGGADLLGMLDRLWRNTTGQTAPALNQEWAERYIAMRPKETSGVASHSRACVWRELARFALRRGFDAYIPDFLSTPAFKTPYTPFIYTRAQLFALFAAVDAMKPFFSWSPRRTWTMGLLYRLLYGAGLRLGEALNLRYCDFDVETGLLTIRKGKNQTTRVIPITASLVERMREHLRRFPDTTDTPFFRSPLRRNGWRTSTVQVPFLAILRTANLPPRTNRQGPRIHDLRHTFAVHRLENWIRAGEDVNNKVHLLSVYMGHVNIGSTYYYLRVTQEMFPHITARLNRKVGSIIPDEDTL